MEQMQNLVLKVDEIGGKDNRVTIKSNNRTYSFFKLKKDQSESVAWKNFQELGVAIGGTYSFAIKESEGEYNGKPITYRNIMTIAETDQTQGWSQTREKPIDKEKLFNIITGLTERIDNLEQRLTVLEGNPPTGVGEPESRKAPELPYKPF